MIGYLLIALGAVLVIIVIVYSLRENQEPDPTQLTPEFQDYVDAAAPVKDLARVMGWPQQWMICPACAQQSWIIPPHLFSPCPLLAETAGSMGLKLDAERMTAVRAGTAMERQIEMLTTMLNEHFDEEDEE